ncbi:MAG TPA: T9SS type A sorting domain-containing protein, partial [Bacteroidia bacterium]|nr:T9SS type A sorting domain-containing protein [Bacteroidia bacterium]
TPSSNSNGPAFGLWAALPTGGNLVQLPLVSATSINEITSEYVNANVFPNPNTNQVNVTINTKETQLATAIITDLSGRVLIQVNSEINAGENTITINTTELNAGLYILNVYHGNVVEQAKLIKE